MKKFKIILFASVSLFVVTEIMAQATPMSTTIENQNRNAVMIEINQPVNIATEALQQKLQRAGLNEKIRNGSVSYKGVILSEISKDKIDLYTKVEGGPNSTSLVYMAVSKGYNNITGGNADSVITRNVVAFLNSFVKDADNHSRLIAIQAQPDAQKTDIDKKKTGIDESKAKRADKNQ